MTFDEFMDRNHQSPVDYNEVAEEAAKVDGKAELRKAAIAYIKARDKFDAALDVIGFEFG